MLLPAHAHAAALLALLALGAAGPARPRRDTPPIEPFEDDPILDSELSRAEDAPLDLPPSAYSWVEAALAHAEALRQQAAELAEQLLTGPLPGWPARRADEAADEAADEEDDEAAEKARKEEEEAAKVAAMEAFIHEQQLEMEARVQEAQEAMKKHLAAATQGLSHLFRFRRSAAPWDSLGLHAFAAALPGLRQMDELIRIKNGAPLDTIRLPGFPSHLFASRGGLGLPGFLF